MRKLAEIERTIRKLRDLPRIGSFRDEIAAGVRAIPAADKGVICFIVDDDRLEIRIMAISYAGSDWSKNSKGQIMIVFKPIPASEPLPKTRILGAEPPPDARLRIP